MKRNEMQEGFVVTTAAEAAVMPAGAGVPAGDGDDGGRCKRAGGRRPLPPAQRGRLRELRRARGPHPHHHPQPRPPPPPAPPPRARPPPALGPPPPPPPPPPRPP